MSNTTPIIGMDIGGTKTAVVVGDLDGRIHDRIQFATRAERGFEATFDEILAAARTLMNRAKITEAVISVSIGGPLDLERGVIMSPPNLPGWDDIPLKALLEECFGLRVYIEHDGNAGALAEWRFGAARGFDNVVFLTMGTGFGGGLIIGGRLHRGASSSAGEVGHIRLAENGPVGFGKAGSWEGLCGGSGIAKRASLSYPDRWGDGVITTMKLAQLAFAGDGDAIALFSQVGRDLGRGLAILIDILNPEIIVIGSLAVRLGDLVLAPAREIVQQEALPAAAEICQIVPARLDEKLGDVASLCAAVEALSRISE